MSTLRGSFKDQYDHGWSRTFTEDTPTSERKAWCEKLVHLAEQAKIPFIHQETQNSIVFAFHAQADWMRFSAIAAAIDNSPGKHRYTHHSFPNEQVQKDWIALAQTYLDQVDIPYEIELHSSKAIFTFDSSTDRLVLSQLVSTGILDDGTNALSDIRDFKMLASDYSAQLTEIDTPGNTI